jgi:hypothetical protein
VLVSRRRTASPDAMIQRADDEESSPGAERMCGMCALRSYWNKWILTTLQILICCPPQVENVLSSVLFTNNPKLHCDLTVLDSVQTRLSSYYILA